MIIGRNACAISQDLMLVHSPVACQAIRWEILWRTFVLYLLGDYGLPMGCLWVAYGMLVCGTLLRILYGLGIGSSLTDKYGFVVMPNSIIANHNI